MDPEVGLSASVSSVDLSSMPPPSSGVDSPPIFGSPEETVVVDLPQFSPSDDDLEHERNGGEDHNQDQGDQSVAAGVLTDDLKRKIIRQVEYYFSDENLPTDKYLLNAMKRNKEGYVPITTIATFRKMKKLTRDIALIVSALKESSLLVVSSDGKKVKRLNPLPEVKDPKLFTVVVENLPEDHSEENIRKIFREAGKIKSVSVCDPNAAEELEKGVKKEKMISTRLHAFVEYETVEAAEKAAATLNNEQDWRNGLRVRLLKQAGKYGQRRQVRRETETESNGTGRVHEHNTGEEEHKKANEHHQHHRQHHSDTNDEDEGGHQHHQKDKNGGRGRGRGRNRRQNYHHGNNGTGHGTAQSSSSSSGHHPAGGEFTKPPPGPRMPDGTRGFTMGRGRPTP
ncbi:PREDICTED: la-related protein 6A isoform X2 [Tarenaya hassleriana]|uniref:la-related protein 6A isoform X2 n=1 Tax=Tarenaya hassleriana TaxID=28532 RepID=UPI00053C352A|nr:PREDICTED: la-related protein 6A isoform X2 [Tarenaya hassleriana]